MSYIRNVTPENFQEYFKHPEVDLTPAMTLEEAMAMSAPEVYTKSVELFGEGSHDPIAVGTSIVYERFPSIQEVINNPDESNKSQRMLAKMIILTVIQGYKCSPVLLYVDTSETRSIYVQVLLTAILDDTRYDPYDLFEHCATVEKDPGYIALMQDQENLDNNAAFVHKLRAVVDKAALLGTW